MARATGSWQGGSDRLTSYHKFQGTCANRAGQPFCKHDRPALAPRWQRPQTRTAHDRAQRPAPSSVSNNRNPNEGAPPPPELDGGLPPPTDNETVAALLVTEPSGLLTVTVSLPIAE